MTWGNSGSKWGRKKTRDRGPVEWVDKNGVKPAPFARDIPPNRAIVEPPPDVLDGLVVGTLFVANHELGTMYSGKNMEGGALPALVPFGPVRLVKLGDILLYAGPIRLEERQVNGRIVTVLRHTFIVAGNRFVVTDLSSVRPA